jgi:hypothetical protein
MKFQVPQFIEIEDKIFGPLSFKEFAYIAGGCGLSFILYRYIPSFLIALIVIAPVLIFAGLLAFYRPNNKPFIEMVQSALTFAIGSKLYIWKKEKKPLQTKEVDFTFNERGNAIKPDLSENKLNTIARDLDLKI